MKIEEVLFDIHVPQFIYSYKWNGWHSQKHIHSTFKCIL